MSPATPNALPVFELKKQKQLVDGKFRASLEAVGSSNPAVLAAIGLNEPFPEGDITLGQFGLKASSGSPLVFRSGQGPLAVSGTAGVFGQFGVYEKSTDLIQELKRGPLAALPEFGLPKVRGRRYALLASGYEVAAKASAALALGPVPVQAKMEARSAGFLGVISAIEAGRGAQDAIAGVLDGLVPPGLLRHPDQLPPGSWVVAEIEGNVGVTLGTQLGLDFNWVREAQLQGLEGDIGLKLQTAISASIGYQAAGSWLVVVGRETEAETLRLQLFRMASRKLNVAMDAKVTAKLNVGILPEKADDLIRGLLGVHGAQILKDLAVLETWTDPKADLNALLAKEGLEAAKGLVAAIGGVSAAELTSRAEEVQQRVAGLIGAWKQLPHLVATEVLSLVEAKTPMAPVREFLLAMEEVSSTEGLLGLLRDRLRLPALFPGAVEKLIEAMAGGGVLALASRPLEEVRVVAEKTRRLLDGDIVEQALERLAEYLNGPLSPERLGELVGKADLKKLEPLLQDKLAKFFAVANPAALEVEKVRQTLGLLLRKRQEFYGKAVEALKRTYAASLSASFSRSSKSTAQLDVLFDFRGNPVGLSDLLQQAIGGNFDAILTQPQAGVTLNLALLTHGMQKKTNVELTLPFLNRSFSHWNESLASLEAIEDGGRVLVYGLEARDTVVTNQRNSTLSLGMTLASREGAGALNLHEAPPLRMCYELRQYLRRLDRADVEHQLAPLIATYFPGRVEPRKIAEYTKSLEERTEVLIPNSPEFYGDALFQLECVFVATDAKQLGEVWLGLGTEAEDESYQQMSLEVQRTLKQLTHDCYFQSPDRYLDLKTAHLLLAWAAIPAMNNRTGELFWDWKSDSLRQQMLAHPSTVAAMKKLLERASDRLKQHSRLAGQAQFFKPADAVQILGAVDRRDPRLEGLLFAEAATVDGIYQAGKSIAKFVEKSRKKPAIAVQELARFGARLTEVLNSGPASVFLGSMARPLGTALYVAAMRGLSEGKLNVAPLATARLAVLRGDLEFSAREFLESGKFPEADLVLSDQICS